MEINVNNKKYKLNVEQLTDMIYRTYNYYENNVLYVNKEDNYISYFDSRDILVNDDCKVLGNVTSFLMCEDEYNELFQMYNNEEISEDEFYVKENELLNKEFNNMLYVLYGRL